MNTKPTEPVRWRNPNPPGRSRNARLVFPQRDNHRGKGEPPHLHRRPRSHRQSVGWMPQSRQTTAHRFSAVWNEVLHRLRILSLDRVGRATPGDGPRSSRKCLAQPAASDSSWCSDRPTNGAKTMGQHYVPQSYLRRFADCSDGGRFGRTTRKNLKTPPDCFRSKT